MEVRWRQRTDVSHGCREQRDKAIRAVGAAQDCDIEKRKLRMPRRASSRNRRPRPALQRLQLTRHLGADADGAHRLQHAMGKDGFLDGAEDHRFGENGILSLAFENAAGRCQGEGRERDPQQPHQGFRQSPSALIHFWIGLPPGGTPISIVGCTGSKSASARACFAWPTRPAPTTGSRMQTHRCR